MSAAKRASCRLLHDLDGEHLQVDEISSIFGALGASPAKVCLVKVLITDEALMTRAKGHGEEMRGLQASHRRLLGEPDDETAMDMLPSGFMVMPHACSSSPPDTTSSSCCAAYGVILPTPEGSLGQLFPRFKTVSSGACSGHCSESEHCSEKLAPELERSER